MRIIDLLNKKANRKLKNGFKFVYDNYVFIFDKNEDVILSAKENRNLGEIYKVENILLDKIELIKIEEEEYIRYE